MSVTISGTSGVTTPGIANSEGYSGDGLTIAAGAPAGAVTINSTYQTFSPNGSEAMRLDASGNLGLGVTPSSWWSSGKAMQVGSGASLLGTTTASQMLLGANYYYNGSNSIYIASQHASYYQQVSGVHSWHTAPSGTAGNPITFTQAMTLDASGNLTISGATATKASGTTWVNPSDQRLKDNIRDYGKGISELMRVRVREWEYNGKGGTTAGLKGLGVVADEIEGILPNTVETYEAKLEETDEDVATIKKFDATEITWLLVKTVQEQQAMITELKARIEQLEAK